MENQISSLQRSISITNETITILQDKNMEEIGKVRKDYREEFKPFLEIQKNNENSLKVSSDRQMKYVLKVENLIKDTAMLHEQQSNWENDIAYLTTAKVEQLEHN